jgi:hypothetical protein
MNTAHRNDVAIDQRTPDWPELLSRIVDDLSQIARTEMELLNTRLRMLLEAETDKIAGVVTLLVALSHGSLFLLGGIVFLIHLWLVARRLDRRRRDIPSLQYLKNRARAVYRKICCRLFLWRRWINTGPPALDLLFRTGFLFRSRIHQSLRRWVWLPTEG